MRERQHSNGQIPKHPANKNLIKRHSYMQRENIRRLFQKQDSVNNNCEKVSGDRLRRLVLKHTHLGDIETLHDLNGGEIGAGDRLRRLVFKHTNLRCTEISQTENCETLRSERLCRLVLKQFKQSNVGVTEKYQTNNSEQVTCNRLRRLVLKHTHLGFIERFQQLALDKTHDTDNRVGGESDELVPHYEMPEDLIQDSNTSFRFINKDEFQLGRVLGSGGFGSVYLGTFKRQTVAIKVMHKYTQNPAAQFESFKAELHVMRFNHQNIVKTLATTHIDLFDDGAWVVMEYISNSSLNGFINDTAEPFDADRRLKYSIQIASALAYAHKNKVAHLDLKPANILITGTDDCKVGDFGCSQRVEFDTGIISPTNRSILTGTFAYRAPELLRGEAPTFKADIYSYAVTMWQMKSRETPFTNENQHVVIYGVVAHGLRPKDPEPSETDTFELSYKELYSKCWNACRLDRPSAQELVDLLNDWKDHM